MVLGLVSEWHGWAVPKGPPPFRRLQSGWAAMGPRPGAATRSRSTPPPCLGPHAELPSHEADAMSFTHRSSQQLATTGSRSRMATKR